MPHLAASTFGPGVAGESVMPTFHSGGTLVDIADRNALYQAMEGR